MPRSTKTPTETIRTSRSDAFYIDITSGSAIAFDGSPSSRGRTEARWLGALLLLLGGGLALNSLLGPLLLEVIDYHVSPDFTNQTIGLDAIALVVVAPWCVLLGWMQLLGSERVSGVGLAAMTLAPGLFAMYMLPQYVIGPDYLVRPGNNQRFFLGHLLLFILSAGVSILAWRAIDEQRLPRTTRRTRLVAAGVLFAGAILLVLGLHLPGVIDGLRRTPTNESFLADPTAFWTVKFLDLGIIVPASVLGGVALLKGARGSQRLMYALIGWLTLDAIAVSAMAITMEINDDPNSSRLLALGFVILAVGLGALMVKLCLPLWSWTGRFDGSVHDHFAPTSRSRRS